MELLLFKLLLLNINGFWPSVFHPLIFAHIFAETANSNERNVQTYQLDLLLENGGWIESSLAFRICHCRRDEENLIALALAMLAGTDWEIWKHNSSITGAVWSCVKEQWQPLCPCAQMSSKVIIYGILATYGDISSNYVSTQVWGVGGQTQTRNTVLGFFHKTCRRMQPSCC